MSTAGPAQKALVSSSWGSSDLQLELCAKISDVGYHISLKDGLPPSTVLLTGSLPMFLVVTSSVEAVRLLSAVKQRLVVVIVVSDPSASRGNGDHHEEDDDFDVVAEAEARLELSRRSLRLDGMTLVVAHVASTGAAWNFMRGVGGVLDKRTLPQHDAKADAIYGAMAAVPPAEAIQMLGGLDEHSALVLEHTFGSVGAVIGFASDREAIASSSVSAAEARLIERFVARNMVVHS